MSQPNMPHLGRSPEERALPAIQLGELNTIIDSSPTPGEKSSFRTSDYSFVDRDAPLDQDITHLRLIDPRDASGPQRIAPTHEPMTRSFQGDRNNVAAIPTRSRIILAWWPEVCCCLISIASVVALVILLRNVNDKRLPEWPLGLTLNTLIAFLSTASRAAFLIVVTEGLSQLKWLHFRGGSPLAHFQAFDDASRGPWGSIRLLTVKRFWPLGLIATAVLVSALLTSTLTQSVISYQTRLAPIAGNANATVTRSTQHYWSTRNFQARSGYLLTVEQAIYSGLYHPYLEMLELDSPRCSTSECRWPPFSSLAICVETTNVTELLQIEPKGVTYSLPNGAFLNISESNLGLVALQNGYQSLAYSPGLRDSPSALFNLFIIYSMPSQGHVIGAAEVLFHFCAKQYNVTVSDNIPSRQILGQSTLVSNGTVSDEYLGEINSTAIEAPDNPGEKFAFGSVPVVIMNEALQSAFNGADGHYTSPSGSESLAAARFVGGFTDATNDSQQSERVDVPHYIVIAEVIRNITRNVAHSLTNMLLDSEVLGETLAPETYVTVRWAWLSLISLQVGLSAAFLIITILETSSAGIAVVKNSALSTLFAINSEDKTQLEQGLASQAHQSEYRRIVQDGSGIVGSLTLAERGWSLRSSSRIPTN